MHVCLSKLACCEATSLTDYRRSGTIHHVRVRACFPLRTSASTGRLSLNCSQISFSPITVSGNYFLRVTKLPISSTNSF
jgi:hypothetical protein